MDDLETLEMDDEQLDEQEVEQSEELSDDGSGGDDEYFLHINDRTRYKTPEDAVKGWREMGNTVARLSPYEKIVKQFNIKDPSELVPLLNKALAAQQEKPEVKGKDESDVFSDPNLTPKEKAALKWLQNSAQKLGYVPKKDLEEMAGRLKKLEETNASQAEKSEKEAFNGLVKEGQGHIKSLLTAANIPQAKNPEFLASVEAMISNFIGKDEDRTAAFYAGGDELAKVMEEGVNYVFKVLNIGKITKGADLAKKKTVASQTNQRQVPRRSGIPQKTAAKPATKKGITPAVNEQAWETFQRLVNESNE